VTEENFKRHSELLPCPFCGSDDITQSTYGGYEAYGERAKSRVECNACGAKSGEFLVTLGARGNEIRKDVFPCWNKRAGEEYHEYEPPICPICNQEYFFANNTGDNGEYIGCNNCDEILLLMQGKAGEAE
jgi:Lar family restriction alleviation protein